MRDSKRGTVIAVCTSPNGGVPKYSRERVRVARFGLEDDYHCRAERPSFSEKGKMKPNYDRHVTIVAEEAIRHANESLGLELGVGSLAENFFTRGLGDLSDVPEGSLVLINHGAVVLHVTGQNKPCKNLSIYHRELVRTIYGKRGLLCSVVSGVGRIIEPGVTIEILQNSRR